MLKMLTAYTEEIDDAAAAVDEILDQLEPDKNLLKNSVGIITCYSEFINSGIVEELCGRLPFDIIGSTSLASGNPDNEGIMNLCISVLTSDDSEFLAVPVRGLSGNLDPIETAYNNASKELKGKPSMILAYFPLILNLGGEALLKELDRVSGGTPVFGTLSCDHTMDFETAKVIYNGTAENDMLSMVIMTGNINPGFIVSNIQDKKIQKQRAIITKSEGSLLQEVNDITVLEYIKTLGLMEGSGFDGLKAIPFIVDFNDGTQPVARAMYLINSDGEIVCGGDMPVGTTLAIGSLDYNDVLETAEELVNVINEYKGANGVFLFPCLSRNMVLGTAYLDELEKISKLLKIPYHICYSGGEICPVYNKDMDIFNRFHNFSIIACII